MNLNPDGRLMTAAIVMGVLFPWLLTHELAVADEPRPSTSDQKSAANRPAAKGANPNNIRGAERAPGLFDAVRAVNEKIGKLQIAIPGDRQAPMPEVREVAPVTVDEIVTSIRSWDREKSPVEDVVFQIYQKIAESKTLPPRAELRARIDWFDPDRNDKYEYRLLRVEMNVMTGENRGYSHRIREQRVGQRIALRPRRGYEWIIHPQPPLPGNHALANGGLVYLMEEDRDGALIVIVTRPTKSDVKDLRALAFDNEGNGHEILGRRLASLNVNTETESVIERFRLDPKKLPRSKVQYVGFQASTVAANDAEEK